MVKGKAILKIAALLAVAMSATQFIWTYLTVPKIVEQFERTANLSLCPDELHSNTSRLASPSLPWHSRPKSRVIQS